MTVTRHPIDIEPEVRRLVAGLDEAHEYVISRDLTAHVIVRERDASVRSASGVPSIQKRPR